MSQRRAWSVRNILSTSPTWWSVVVAFTLAACNLPALPNGANSEPFVPPTKLETKMLAQINAARAAGQDCGAKGIFTVTTALTLEPRLSAAAQAHAADMNTHAYFSHTAPDGSTVGTRVTRTGYLWSRVGENIARGYKNVDEVMSGWLASDGHCANLMNPAFTALGVGKSGDYWVQVFARAK